MQLIRYPLSRLSQKKLINFRNDIQNINEKVRIYNENILNERRLKRNERVRSFRKNKKFNELKDKNIEYFNKKQEAKHRRELNEFKEKRSANILTRNFKKFIDVKKEFEVIINLTTNTFWRISKKSYPSTETITHTFSCKKKLLNENVDKFLSEYYPHEDDYKIVTLIEYNFKIKEEFNHRIDKKDVAMKRALPFEASFLKYMNKVNPVSLQGGNNECVIEALSEHLKVKGKPMNKDNLRKIFNEASNHLYNKNYEHGKGITSRMILYLCKQKNISCLGFDQSDKLFVKHTQDDRSSKNYRAIIFYMFFNHFYLINDEETVRHLSQCFKESCVIKMDMEQNITKPKEIIFYKDLSVEEALKLPEGSVVIFEKFHLNEEYGQYIHLTNDVKPKLTYGTLTLIHKIITKNGVTLTISGCLGEGMSWESIKSICEKNGLVFKNQSFGNLLLELKEKFEEVPRISFNINTREIVKSKNEGKCMGCDLHFDKNNYHIDHIRPLSNGGNNDIENLQALCPTCHRDKCRQENEAAEYIKTDEALSNFNIEITNLLNTNYFRKVAFSEEITFNDNLLNGNIYAVDMNKTRRNILFYPNHKWYVYNVIDNIEPFNGNIVDGIYYVECNNEFPLRGNMFYSKEMVIYALDNNLIHETDIKYQLLPSNLLKEDYFQSLGNYILKCFDGNNALQKLSINSLVGLFGRRNHSFYEYRVCNKNDIDDIGCYYEELNKPFINEINDEVVTITGEVKVKKLESFFPIHLQILDDEAIELHKLKSIIENNGGIPITLKTDCVVYKNDQEINIDDYYWDKEKTVKKYKHEEVFSYQLKAPMKLENNPPVKLMFDEYNQYGENDKLDDNIINSNKGILILGPAGTGKTYLINSVINKLENKKILRLAPTNKAALLIKGQTLDRFAYNLIFSRKNSIKYKNIDYVFVDEISMVSSKFIKVLLSLKYYNPDIKFIISGDFYQIPPVKDNTTKLVSRSKALYELVDGNMCNLTICKRSNHELFNICEKVKHGKNIDTSIFNNKESNLNICFTNKKRIEINQQCNERYIKETGVKFININKLPYDDNSQPYKLYKGIPLISRLNIKKHNVYNNEFYSVKEWNKEYVVVKNEMNEVKLSINDIPRMFNVGYCITTHKSQGETFQEPYTIYEWKKMDSTLRYVSLSRSTNKDFINII